MALTVEILTPDAAMWTGEASALVARSREGFFTVLAGHADLEGNIEPGVVRVSSADGERSILVHGGFFQVKTAGGDTVATVAAAIAEPTAEIDAARARSAKERAEAALAGDLEDDARAWAQADLERAERRLAAAGA